MNPIYTPVPDHPFLVRRDLSLTEIEMLVLITMLYNMRPVGYLFGDYTEAGAGLSTYEWTRIIFTLIGAQIFERFDHAQPGRIRIHMDAPGRLIIHESEVGEMADVLPAFDEAAIVDNGRYLHGPFS